LIYYNIKNSILYANIIQGSMFMLQLPKEVLTSQLSNGLLLLVLGMGTVFVFLTILVVVTKTMSKIVGKLESKKPVAAPVAAPVAQAPAPAADAEVAAAIVAALAKSGK
jgi:oxaloacetate decarboxylase gamma subunit